MIDPTSLGAEIARWRRLRGMGLSALASRAGLAKATLSYWESGRRTPTGTSLARVLDLLEVPERERARLLSLADPAFARWELAHGAIGAPVGPAQVLRAMRRRRGWTQADLARAVGVAQSTVAKWESGEREPTSEALQTALFELRASPEEAAALTASNGRPPAPEGDFLDRFRAATQIPIPLQEVTLMGLEAELWPKAASDPKWDEPLLVTVSCRIYGYFLQLRFDDVLTESARALRRAAGSGSWSAATPAFLARGSVRRRRGTPDGRYLEQLDGWIERCEDSRQRLWAEGHKAEILGHAGHEREGVELSHRTLDRLAKVIHVSDSMLRGSVAEVHLAAGNASRALELLPEGPAVLRTRIEAYVRLGKLPPDEWIETIRAQMGLLAAPIDFQWLARTERDIARLRRRKA